MIWSPGGRRDDADGEGSLVTQYPPPMEIAAVVAATALAFIALFQVALAVGVADDPREVL